jgi:hypothetical protein
MKCSASFSIKNLANTRPFVFNELLRFGFFGFTKVFIFNKLLSFGLRFVLVENLSHCKVRIARNSRLAQRCSMLEQRVMRRRKHSYHIVYRWARFRQEANF